MRILVGKGITVGGVPLEDHLAFEEEDGKSKEAEKSRNDIVRDRKRIAASVRRPKARYAGSNSKRSRVKRFTDNELRRLYGIMEKPFETVVENLLWVLKEYGPLTSNQLKQYFPDMPYSSLSSRLSVLYKRMEKLGLMSRSVVVGGKGYTYELTEKTIGHTAQELATYLDKRKGRKVLRPPKAKNKPDKKKPAADEVAPEKQPPKEEPFTDPFEAISEVVSKQLGVNVVVSGKIEIVFKLGD